jgi:hypothetical protein
MGCSTNATILPVREAVERGRPCPPEGAFLAVHGAYNEAVRDRRVS